MTASVMLHSGTLPAAIGSLVSLGAQVVMALFLWATDKTLEWVIFSLILGWTR